MFSASDKRLALITAYLLVVLGMLFASPNVTIAAQPLEDLGKVALKLVAERIGLPMSELMVVSSATAEYPQDEAVSGPKLVDNRKGTVYLAVVNSTKAEYRMQGKIVYKFKVIDNRDGAIYGITLDESGQELDPAKLESDERAAYAARYGKLEPALTELLAGLSGNEPIEVIIWLKEPPYVGPERPVPNAPKKQLAAFFTQVDAARAMAVGAVTAPVADKLVNLGYEVKTDPYAPVLYAYLPPSVIQEVANWDEVDTVYLSPINRPDLEVARPTIRADAVNARGITGSGVRVAQIEVGGRIATSNPYLSGTTQNTTYVCSSASSHSTAVAGIIRSTHSSRRGIASGVSLWAGGSCSGSSSELQNRSTAAANWGAQVINLSWGANIGLTPGVNDRFYDNMVINRYRTIVKSAGNQAGICGAGNGNITSPGLAYNVITVGNFDDRNTIGWSDDVMNSCSSWRDPVSTHGDREKPEVAAPGTNINSTTTSSPWTGAVGSGTSYAAPMVTGVAALLIQRNSSLGVWPEAIKAILMATAVHNIEGGKRLSEYDGAGGIVADRADDVARGVSGSWGGESYSCSTITPLDVATMYLYAGKRTRVAIAWDTDPSYSGYASEPSADLDLEVVSPSGSVVTGSYSWDNTYEIVDFTPSSSGYYKLRVIRHRCDYSPRWLGWAWWRQGN